MIEEFFSKFSKKILRSLGLLNFAKRIRDKHVESQQFLRSRKEGLTDKYPTPPGNLIDLIVASQDVYWYYVGGKLAKDNILSSFEQINVDINKFQNVLDFGCGCGRVLRKWCNSTFQIYGTDYNPILTDFCKNALPFAKISTNNLYPPLHYSNEQFDFIYLFSVFTHLTFENQIQWLKEFHRILKPNGYLLFTMQGPYFMSTEILSRIPWNRK